MLENEQSGIIRNAPSEVASVPDSYQEASIQKLPQDQMGESLGTEARLDSWCLHIGIYCSSATNDSML